MAINRERNFIGKTPILFLISTPIGNLSEFSPRAIETIKDCDYIACEDTRVTGSLLSHFSIKKPLISCHEHNEEKAAEQILSLMSEGKKIAYMSDAGYPSISDPGGRLTRKALAAGYKVSVVNGPNAALTALVGSGLNSDHYCFYGFLDAKPSKRKKEIESLVNVPFTLIFYESPHRIKETLQDLSDVLGNRNACLARELTKLNEEYIRAPLCELAALDEESLKGELVIVIEGFSADEEINEDDIVSALSIALQDKSSKEAIAEVSKSLGAPKNLVYQIYLSKFKK